MLPDSLQHNIETDWANDARLGAACLAVAHYVYEAEGIRHLTFGKLRRIVSRGTEFELSEQELVSLAAYLCREDLGVLRIGFEFVDEDEEVHPLTNHDVSLAKKINGLPHPVTGQLIENFEQFVLVFFEPGDQIERK